MMTSIVKRSKIFGVVAPRISRLLALAILVAAPGDALRADELERAPETQSLADVLGFDPVAVDASHESAARGGNREAKVENAPEDDAIARYEATLLADRRVAYGVARELDSDSGRSRLERRDAADETPENLLRAPNSDRYGESTASTSVAPTNVARQTTRFNSNAYGGGEERPAESASKGATLEIGDAVDFAREDSARVRDEDDEALGEGAFAPQEEDAEEEKDGADSVAELQDECYAALNPYTSLFIAYEPTYDWTESILEYVDSILTSIEDSPEQTRALLEELKRRTQEADQIKATLEEADKRERANRDPWNGGERPELCARYSLAQRLELVDSFKSALQRRVFLWKYAADFFEARNRGELRETPPLSRQELEALLKTTKDVREFFGETANGKSWRASFDVDVAIDELEKALKLPAARGELQYASVSRSRGSVGYLGQPEYATAADPYLDKMIEEDARTLSAVEKERARRLRFLQDRVNAIAYKIEKTPMTPTQRQVFNRPTTAAWASLVTGLAGDQTNGMPLLIAFEKYERVAGGAAGAALQQLALRMTTSQSEVCRLYGRTIDAIYDNPNVKVYISEALINRLLPIRDPEFEVVQETILNNPVVGRRRVDARVSIKLTPDPERLLMSLDVNGRVHANTNSEVLSARLHNESYAYYVGRKTLEWSDSGILYSPAAVNASAAARLNGVETNIDFVPIVGDLARGLTRTQYQSRLGAIEAEARDKVIAQTRQRFDQESNERFDALNARLRSGFFRNMANLGLSLRTQRSKTTDDWLLASLRFGADYALGCQATEPATLPGAFADIKIHESAVNSFLNQLELSGRTFTPREALDYVADRLNRPKLREIPIEENQLRFTFAKEDPVSVRFYEDKICLSLRFANFELGEQSWDDVETEIAYRPTSTPDGATTLARDGAIALYGPSSVARQIPIRAVFSKIFPAQKTINLRFEQLRRDERFAGLALGLCRVSRGWFAVSVVKDPAFM